MANPAQLDLNVLGTNQFEAVHNTDMNVQTALSSGQIRTALMSASTGTTTANQIGRNFHLTRLLGITANYQGDADIVAPAPLATPLQFRYSGIEGLPAIWCQQTENQVVVPLPAAGPGSLNFTALRNTQPLPPGLLAANNTLAGSFPIARFIPQPNQDPLHSLPQSRLLSGSFLDTIFQGVDIRTEGMLQLLGNGFQLPMGTSQRQKWVMLTSNPNLRRVFRQYIRLALNRYATFRVPNQPTQLHVLHWQGNIPGSPPVNQFYIYDTSAAIFHYNSTLRRVSGWWGRDFHSEGAYVQVDRDLNIIRKRVVQVTVGGVEPLGYADYMEVIYERLRVQSSIFTPNDADVPYYVKCHFYISEDDSVNNDLPPEAIHHFIADTAPLGPPRAKIKAMVTAQLLNILYRYQNADFTNYRLYAEFIFVRDQALIDSIQPVQAITGQGRNNPGGRREVPDEDDSEPPPSQRRRVEPPVSTIQGSRQSRAQTQSNFLSHSKGMGRGGAHVGQTHQARMFIKGSMIRRFSEEKSLFLSPNRPHETCVIMSLFRAERTLYHFQGYQLQEITKSSRSGRLGEHEYMFEASHDREFTETQRSIPFVVELDGKVFLRMGICEKYPAFAPNGDRTEGKYLPGAYDHEEVLLWELAAEEMTAFIEHQLRRDVNINAIDDICQAYADTFRICVSVYDLECRGTRVQVYTPEDRTVQQLLQPGETRILQMVHIALDSGHCHAISHIQSFLSSDHRSKAIGVYQHCPFCDTRTSRDLNSQEKAKKHISECAAHEDGFTSRTDRAFHANLVASPEEVRLSFRKEGPSYYQCKTCCQEVTQNSYLCHTCILPKRKAEKAIPNERIFVYDLEAAQIEDPVTGLKVHQCNCVIVQAVYGPLNEWTYYPSEVEFVQALIAEDSIYKGGVFLAHNGGGYDCQFILRILERWEIEHQYTPTPGTQHKFLQISLCKNEIRLLDFMRFIPGSLKGIAQSFQCAMAKGDFPHHFNNGRHMDYSGPIPPNNPLQEDYWCQRHAKNIGAVKEFETWYTTEASQQYCTCWGLESCICGKAPWVFKEELIKYCILDVQVLSQVVKAYREELMGLFRDAEVSADDLVQWKPIQLDPFSCMTIAQICIRMLSQGFVNQQQHITTLHQRQRGGWNPLALSWMTEQSRLTGETILHRGNWIREYYHFRLQIHLDGFAAVSNTIYWFVDCQYWGCPYCCDIPWEHSIHPERHVRYSDLATQYQVIRDTLHREFRQVEVIWTHEYKQRPSYLQITAEEHQANQLFLFEEAFYGGRTEVFQAYASPRDGETIEHHDVTSLYPSVYLAELPIGIPIHLRLDEIDRRRLHPTAENRYFGFVKVFVIPPRTDRIGLLPLRDTKTGRLCFPVFPMRGVWGTQELYLAMQNGYQVTEIYELYHWEPDQRSSDYLRGYVNTYLRMKQESEGWKKLGADCDDPSEEVKDRLVEELFQQNGGLGRIRKEKVGHNPVKRQLAKLFLNSLWGKFAQKESKFESMTIYGPAQFAFIWSHCAIKKESFTFRETCPGTFKVRFQFKDAYVKHVPHGNLLLAARVTEAGRCVLHERMLRIGPERIIYCDTDSIVFHRTMNMQDLEGVGLGKWVNEYPSKVIEEFASLAPKMYCITFRDTDKESVKAKGVMLSLRNCKLLRMAAMKELLLEYVHQPDRENPIHGPIERAMLGSIQLENMSIFTNCQNMTYSYATMLTRENTKAVRVVLSKRKIVVDEAFVFTSGAIIQTVPWGYQA